jgi:hypothetical protein
LVRWKLVRARNACKRACKRACKHFCPPLPPRSNSAREIDQPYLSHHCLPRISLLLGVAEPEIRRHYLSVDCNDDVPHAKPRPL